jgi:hypothetical protein
MYKYMYNVYALRTYKIMLCENKCGYKNVVIPPSYEITTVYRPLFINERPIKMFYSLFLWNAVI